MKPYRLLVALALCAAIVVPVLALAAHEGGPHVRVAHLATGVGPIDVYVNGKMLVKALTYKSASDYLSLEGGSFEFIVTPAGGKLTDSVTDKPIALTFAADEGKYFTVAAVGSPNDKTFELVKLPADKGETPAGKDNGDDHAAEPGTASAGSLSISGAWARATAMNMPATQPAMGGMAATKPAMGGMAMSAVSAAYMVIKNAGSQPDQLVSVTSDVSGKTEVHETTVKDNVASMHPIPALDVPANGSVELKPGGYHVMMMDLKQPLTPGQTINLTMNFKSGTVIKLVVPVKAP
ncbi:MAG: copper chaperone PCu(A)C [Anaerolineae bacterium]|nr:copper chaperone PCu(A)C [Anaerolineae bacterium]